MVWPFSSSTSGENSQSSDSPADSKTHRLKQAQDRALEKAAGEAQRRKLVDAVNENCALEGAALFECQESWNLRNRLTLCQTFQKGYMDCMNAQRVVEILWRGWCRLCWHSLGMGCRGIRRRRMSWLSGMQMSCIRNHSGIKSLRRKKRHLRRIRDNSDHAKIMIIEMYDTKRYAGNQNNSSVRYSVFILPSWSFFCRVYHTNW